MGYFSTCVASATLLEVASINGWMRTIECRISYRIHENAVGVPGWCPRPANCLQAIIAGKEGGGEITKGGHWSLVLSGAGIPWSFLFCLMFLFSHKKSGSVTDLKYKEMTQIFLRVSTASGNQGKLEGTFPDREKSRNLAFFKKIREFWSPNIFYILYFFLCIRGGLLPSV